jgi:hypothetical protein
MKHEDKDNPNPLKTVRNSEKVKAGQLDGVEVVFRRKNMNQGQTPNLLEVDAFSLKHPSFKKGTLRDIVFKAKPRESSKGTIPSNGFEGSIVRYGNRVFIDEDEFFRCLKRMNPDWNHGEPEKEK